MISVIVYGRNDAHGYNLHRRAALSLNCIAEVLTDRDDEIVFVDYNTPDELPTFVEALADTLTERCLSLLRVIRVPAAVHERRYGGRTHLSVVEPVARNAGARRTNPSNRWLLLTNTDMILLPHSAESLSEICGDLADGFYGLPRFELPEWLWEDLPRSDPAVAMAEIKRLGPRLRLDEPTLSNEWIRFDAPGDFQLALREDFFAIDGLNEDMLLGYHVDSNFSKRMRLRRGSIESVTERLAGYHCNHNRTPTVYHGSQVVTNDLERFLLLVEHAELREQRRTWGLVDDELEEVSLRDRSTGRFAAAVAAASPDAAGPPKPSDAARIPFELTYDTGHVLPFVADSLAVAPPGAAVGYIGVNAVLERSLATLVAQLGQGRSLGIATLEDSSSVDALAESADLFVVDLGLDESLDNGSVAPADQNQPAELPATLAGALAAFERLVKVERARLERGEHPRRFVLVHSWTVFSDAYVLANLDCSHATAHSRVRRATVRPAPAEDEATRAALAQERRFRRWATRGAQGGRRLSVHPGEEVELADLSDYGGFGEGWSYPEERGLWTEGSPADLALTLEPIDKSGHVLALSVDSICVARDATLKVKAVVGGTPAAARDFAFGDPDWYIELTPHTSAKGELDLAFEIDDASSPVEVGWSDSDDRRLGIRLRTITLLPADDEAAQNGLERELRLVRWAVRGESGERRLHIRPSETVELEGLNDYGGFDRGWILSPDQAGVWTEGSHSELALELDAIGDSDYAIVLSLGSICVKQDAALRVEALVDGERAAARDLSFGEPEWRIESPLPAPPDGKVTLTLLVADANSPRAVGWSDDERTLGVLVRAIAVEKLDHSVRPNEKVVFADGSDAARLLGTGWSKLEPTGVWTNADEASLVIRPTDALPRHAELVLAVTPFVTPNHPELTVEAWALGEQLARRVFRLGDVNRLFRIPLPAAAWRHKPRVRFELRLRNPARPADLGVGTDNRYLGLHLRWLVIGKTAWLDKLGEVARNANAALRSRTGRTG